MIGIFHELVLHLGGGTHSTILGPDYLREIGRVLQPLYFLGASCYQCKEIFSYLLGRIVALIKYFVARALT